MGSVLIGEIRIAFTNFRVRLRMRIVHSAVLDFALPLNCVVFEVLRCHYNMFPLSAV